jgi:hypothetical protein
MEKAGCEMGGSRVGGVNVRGDPASSVTGLLGAGVGGGAVAGFALGLK